MLYLIRGVLFVVLLLPIIISELIIVQSQHYELNKYLYYDTKKKIILQIALLTLLLISFLYKETKLIITLISLILTNTLLVNKEKIKMTSRIKRLLIIYFIITILLTTLLSNLFSGITLFLILNNSIIFYFLFINILSIIIESIIRSYYIRDAKRIVKKLKVIGITGSYGKTSCKNIIYDMLEKKYNVSKTPKSYNTQIGIIKSIRENINNFDKYFICEYGVDKKRGMNSLLKVVKPNISLITEVGSQHLLTFKNIENIKKEKIKLAKVLKENEVAIINNDNKYLKEEISDLKCKVITYGINSDSNIMAKNIEITNKGSQFDLYIYKKKIGKIKINLLGEHNVLNVLGAIGVLKVVGVKEREIKELTKNIRQVEHRLCLKKIDNIKVIDDSFNSNEKGFKMAIDILSLMEEERIVITPGIIEQGKSSESVNYELGKYMANKVDYVVLVEKNALVMKKGLIEAGFKESKIIIKDNFIDAWNYLKENHNSLNKIILIENDLPSIYLK